MSIVVVRSKAAPVPAEEWCLVQRADPQERAAHQPWAVKLARLWGAARQRGAEVLAVLAVRPATQAVRVPRVPRVPQVPQVPQVQVGDNVESVEHLTATAQEALLLAIAVSLPIVVIAAITGLVVAVLQAATQVQDMTLSHLPRLLVVSLALVIVGPWIGSQIAAFAARAFAGG